MAMTLKVVGVFVFFMSMGSQLLFVMSLGVFPCILGEFGGEGNGLSCMQSCVFDNLVDAYAIEV
jgi:hypothetical protein